MASKTNKVRIVARGRAWKVKTDGARRAALITESRSEAITRGRRIAMNKGLELIISAKAIKPAR